MNEPDVVNTLQLTVVKKQYDDGTERTEIRGTKDLVLALNILHDAQGVLVGALTKEKMEGGESNSESRIIIPNITFSKN
uniref:Uncharacterized protein n=1 Tax=viral metagenome TaxID=1070528 RepID=A0A6M3J1Z5_9ZZZZ